jgi:beta-lactam-binding protein with PASTA domain
LPGSEVRSRSIVTLTVAIEPKYVEIPAISGEPAAQARDKLKALGLKVKEKCVNVVGLDLSAGYTAGTEPQAGTKVLVGSTVILLVGQNSCGQ